MSSHVATLMFMVLLGVVAAQLDGSLSPRMLETLQGRCAAELAAPSSPRALYAALQYSDETVACANLGLIHTATSYSDVVYAHLACMRAKCDCGETIGTAAMRLIDAGVKGLGEDVGAAKAYLSAVAAGVAPADERVLEAASAMYTQGDDNVVSDPELFQLLNGAGVKTNIKPKHLSLSFQVFLSAASGADVAQAAAAVGALTALETTKFFPVHTRLTTNTFAAGSKISLTFATTTALDQPVADANVQVKSVSNSAGENVPFSDGAVMAAGLYSVATSLSLAERSKPISSTLSFVVQAQASVTGVRALISPDHAIDTSDMPKGSFMEGDNEGHAEKDHVVHVAFSVSGAADALQTVVRFTHSETGKSVYVPTKSASGAGTYKATVALADKAKMFDHSSGTYHVVILVGDAALAAPVLTSVGDVQLAFTPPVKIIEPLYAKSLLDESDRTLKPMPTIEHAMRDAPTRASPVLSFIFSIVPVAAGLIFVATAAYIQSKKTSPAASFGPIELGFLVCCMSLLAMTTSFWLGLTFFSFYSTIKYLCILAPVTAFFAIKLASQ